VEGSSVTLTCSSDANPAANYTWYKKNHTLLSKEPQLIFSSIQSSDSGEFYCTAENDLGKTTSKYVLISVKCDLNQYIHHMISSKFSNAPKNLSFPDGPQSVSVSPSGQIVEGRPVTLTCSSDANPAANYTWYKENQTLLHGPEGTYQFSSIRSEDSGTYYCRSENQLGQSNSSSVSIDVQYPPKLLSVSVSPSAEIVEGSSVTLTCSSDANPAAKYTWYKKNGNPSLQPASKQFNFSSIQSSDSGEYYCTAENDLGGRTSGSIFINVTCESNIKHPSAEIVEGSSLTLTCSSDANPAANFTWYKENQTLIHGPEGTYQFTSISSEDRGTYYCRSENHVSRKLQLISHSYCTSYDGWIDRQTCLLHVHVVLLSLLFPSVAALSSWTFRPKSKSSCCVSLHIFNRWSKASVSVSESLC
uniref:Ig-like domain-containing protein n=1 Tax=Mastacembelus armatus TaxID=205130 RepID=A0A3Q3RME6_9TELE